MARAASVVLRALDPYVAVRLHRATRPGRPRPGGVVVGVVVVTGTGGTGGTGPALGLGR
jgi:hypothetical protein